jgi:uncharacterized protein YjbJ (UPF0337 family)
MWNKDEIEGKGKKIEGAVEKSAGEFVTNPDLEAAGKAERFEGILQEKAGEVCHHADDAVEKVADVISAK